MNSVQIPRMTFMPLFVGPELTITAASPREENGPLHTSLPVMTCVDRLGMSIERFSNECRK